MAVDLALKANNSGLAREKFQFDAVTLARKLESDAERTAGPQSPLTAITLVVLGQALQTQGETAEAEKVLRRALAIREKAIEQKMVPFRQSALLKVARGETTTEEIFRVVPAEHLLSDE